jgi:phosphatidylserine/phosphatidylglycerophosphate/cardiolipin synthase-like enzyme
LARFLNTSATNYYLEEMIKGASERLILISPFLKLNDRIKELIEDKNRLKIDVRIVYGKSELQPEEINWLRELTYIRTSFCKNLHAKCYINESSCIITSLNLYQFSQINNNEMGVFIDRNEDSQIYSDAFDEAQRIIRISDEIRISLEKVGSDQVAGKDVDAITLLPTSKLAKKLNLSSDQFLQLMIKKGYLKIEDGSQSLTELGKSIGSEHIKKSRFGPYFKWPEDLNL